MTAHGAVSLSDGYESWESVLAGVEEDVRRTEQLLAVATMSPDLSADPTMPAPAELMLPLAPEPDLPDIARMPRIPDELIARASQLRERIAALRLELEHALDQVVPRTPPAPVRRLHAVTTPSPPRFIDRAM